MTATPAPPAAEGRQPLPPRSPSGRHALRLLPLVPALIPLALTAAIVLVLVGATDFENFGGGFFGFNPANNGVMVFVLGSFLTSIPALLLAMAVGLGIAIASATYLPRYLAGWLEPFVDLLAGIPSIVYGIWGYFVVAPYFGQNIFPWTVVHLAWLPGFARTAASPTATGDGLALAIIILFLMILPITTVLMRDALRAVPRDLWESGLALGATRWEVNRRVAIPYAKRGIWGAAFLGFGRAIGETVAVFMVIDQAEKIPTNIYDGTSTMSAFIISDIDTAFLTNPTGRQTLHLLAELALLLLAITLVVNLAGRWLVRRTYTEVAGL